MLSPAASTDSLARDDVFALSSLVSLMPDILIVNDKDSLRHGLWITTKNRGDAAAKCIDPGVGRQVNIAKAHGGSIRSQRQDDSLNDQGIQSLFKASTNDRQF